MSGGIEVSHIKVVGLGAGDIEQLSVGVYRLLKEAAAPVYVRTVDHPVIKTLQAEGLDFIAFDDVYEANEDFETVYERIVAQLMEAAECEPIIYAVPGHPMLAEKTVELLLANETVQVEIVGGQSYLDDLFTALKIDPIDGFQFLDGTAFNREMIQYRQHLIFCQVYDAFIASEVKLTLLEDLPADYEVIIVEAVGTSAEKLLKVPLEDLDRVMEMSNLTSVYVPPVPDDLLQHQFASLREVIRILRGPNGCPWDKKQTHESLRRYALEEVYELIDAIDAEDDEAIIGELGDVLLQVLLHSQIGEDSGYFTVDDVIEHLTKKMIHRHPHVFKPEEAYKTWDELKQEEKAGEEAAFLLDDVITAAPALQVAFELQRKAAKVGFDWDEIAPMWEKWDEEKAEFLEAVAANDRTEMEKEFGDMLFVLVNIARFYQLYPEVALRTTNEKFIQRFNFVEEEVKKSGKKFEQYDLAQLDVFWERAKKRRR